MAKAALVISILSLLVSALAAWYSRSQARSARTVAEVEVLRESRDAATLRERSLTGQQADLTIQTLAQTWRRHRRLSVRNTGPSAADDISFEPDPESASSIALCKALSPLKTLEPDAHFDVDVLVERSQKNPISFGISWRDSLGVGSKSLRVY